MKFEHETACIYHANALEVLQKEIPKNSVDLIFADPPYNIGKVFGECIDTWESDRHYLEWCKSWLDLCISRLKPTGSIYVMASTQSMPLLDLYLRERVSVLSRIVWHYDSSGVQAKRFYGSMYEPILYCVKNPKTYTFNADQIRVTAKTGAERGLIDYRKNPPAPYSDLKVPGNVWYFPRVRFRMPEYAEHPTQKPESLLERIVLASSNPGETVLDPFSGTFTTCAVALKHGRRAIGIELEAKFVDIGLRRLGFVLDSGAKPSATYNAEEPDAAQMTLFEAP